jgi:spore germination cell wall hydrolase CwlJ-like protein
MGTTETIPADLLLHCKKGLRRLAKPFINRSSIAAACPQRVPGGPAGERCQHEQGRSRRRLSGGVFALADEDAKGLFSGIQARADWRALVSAALIGWGVGLALGGIYLGAGMGHAIAEHGRAQQAAQVGQALRGPLANDPGSGAQLAGYANPAQRAAVAQPTHARELDCLTQAVYFEARGESARGQAAVATVIMNRVKNPHFPKTVCGVVFQGASHRNGCQFSFACDGRAERVSDWDAWDEARKVAARALSGVVLRDVGKATYFHTTDVSPDWGSSMLRVAQVGLHVFYRLNPHAPPPDAAEDEAQFASRAAPAQSLRLAAAVVAPEPAADAAAKPAQPAPVAAAADAKAAPKAEPAAPQGPIAKTDAPVAPKADSATTS